jgi:peptidoglycan/LPS O-acetylase OafA/YrhL
VKLDSELEAGSSRGHIPALDGLRGVAILLVFGYHLPWGAFRAGSFGVVLFFVLSGYLITGLLLRELDLAGRVDFRRFYQRRAKRLLPALVLVTIGHLILQLLVLGEADQWWNRTWPVLAYVANIVQIAGDSLVHMSHTWSLAVEEHFYLFWPLLLVLLPKRRRFPIAIGVVVGLALWRSGLLAFGFPHLRILFGTDSNAFAPLLGAVLALGVHDGRWTRVPKSTSAISTFVLIAVACLPLHFTDRRVLWSTIPVAMLSAVAILGAVRHPVFWLEAAWLRWFGLISYGLYLWHYPLISLPWPRSPVPPLVAMTVVPIVVAFLSWRFVEAPILGRSWRLDRLATPRASHPIATDRREGVRV